MEAKQKLQFENVIDRLEALQVFRDRPLTHEEEETIDEVLREFALHITLHTIPASGSTIKGYVGLLCEEIVLLLPDMPLDGPIKGRE